MEDLSLPSVSPTNTDKRRKGMAPRKKKMVEAMAKHLGIVTSACQEVGLNRDTYYQWLKNDKDFAEAIIALEGRKEDVIEKAFLSLVIDRNPQAVIHAVKTKLKYRGYGDEIKNEVHHSGEVKGVDYVINIIHPDGKDNKLDTKQ